MIWMIASFCLILVEVSLNTGDIKIWYWPTWSLGDREGIFVYRLITIIKSKVSTLPTAVICSLVVWLRQLYHHILSVVTYKSREIGGFVSITALLFLCVEKWIHHKPRPEYGCMHIALSHYPKWCIFKWKYWLYKICVRYILPNVHLSLCTLSQLFFMQYMGLCVLSNLSNFY